jgi:hypothetical protein
MVKATNGRNKPFQKTALINYWRGKFPPNLSPFPLSLCIRKG